MQLFTVNSNMHYKRLSAIKVLLQCRLASCNCSIKFSKETHNKTYIPKIVYVPQIRSLVFSVNRNTLTWLAEFGHTRTETLLKFLLPELYFYRTERGKTEKQLTLLRLFETAKRRRSVPTSCSQTQNGDIGGINSYSTRRASSNDPRFF